MEVDANEVLMAPGMITPTAFAKSIGVSKQAVCNTIADELASAAEINLEGHNYAGGSDDGD
jgi:hypothetical protein